MGEVIIISGPTAAGKTARALDLARKMGAEIISCDSVQVYRHMDIGSAKPTKSEREEIPHHLIDVAEVNAAFSVGEYVNLAQKALLEIRARGRDVIVVGGSGFYLKSWFSAVCDDIDIAQSVKYECAELAGLQNPNLLVEKLLSLDPKAAEFIDIKNPRRVRPALERVMASGLSLKMLGEKFATMQCPMGDEPKKFELIDLPDAELFARAKTRIINMLEAGLVEETRALMAMGFEQNPSAHLAIGYRETIEAIRTNDFSNLAENIYASTIRLIKKQRKFFKNSLFKHKI